MHPELNFELRKQQLIEIIKANQIEQAIKFAQTQIAPKCHQQFSKHSSYTDKVKAEKF